MNRNSGFLRHREAKIKSPDEGVATYSTFPSIQPSFVILTQLAQFDKISHGTWNMELVIV